MMKNNMIIAVFGLICCFNAMSQAADHSFSYQGELLEGGSPANGLYDISVQMVDGLGVDVGTASVHDDVQVTNGLFNIDVKIGGISAFDGYENYFFEIGVRPGASAGSYTTLSPVQSLEAVPLATNLVNGSATAGQVLTFNGFQWAPQDPAAGGSSPWTVVGSEINYMNNVGIGIANPASRLHVKSASSESARFDGGTNMYVSFYENGSPRGYVGSFVGGTGINSEDFEIGTHGANNVGNLQFTIQNSAKMTIDTEGQVGIGNVTPVADLNIDGTVDGDVIRVRVNNSTKFYVDDNGGVGVGSWSTPPINGLKVDGDVKQPSTSNGMMKYMVNVNCTSSPTIARQYNGIATGTVTVAATANAGRCSLTFPTNIDQRYWQVSAIYSSSSGSNAGGRSATCRIGTNNNELLCERFLTDTRALSTGPIMILIY